MITATGGVLRRLPGTSRAFGPPRQFCRTLSDYVALSSLANGASFVELRRPEPIERILPNVLGGAVHAAFLSEQRRVLPGAGVAIIPNGRVLTTSGSVIAPPDYLITQTSACIFGDNDPRSDELFIALKLAPPKHVDGVVAVVTTKFASNYFHWLFDTLPRLQLLQEAGSNYDWILAPRKTRFQQESLALMGIADSHFVNNPGLHLEAAALIVPTSPGVSGNPPRWVCDFLRERFLDPRDQRKPERKIYISRSKGTTRRILNEAEVFETLRGAGFEYVCLEDLSFVEQVRLFSEAQVVVAAHGAGLSNLVFCSKETVVIEIFSPNYVNVVYWALANQVNLAYFCMLGESRVKSAATLRKHDNIYVDLRNLRATLRAAVQPCGV